MIPGCTPVGEFKAQAIFSSLKQGPRADYASVQCEFREADGSPFPLCPRSILRTRLETSKQQLGLEFLVGFEIEIVFMSRSPTDGTLSTLFDTAGHAYASSRAVQDGKILDVLGEIHDRLEAAGISLEQFHPESCLGQYEFVLPAKPCLEAADTLLQARDIITTVVAGHSMRATLYPKPFANMAGTASHVHISISSAGGDEPAVYEPFYAGILRHLPSILAFTYSSPASYARMQDHCWAGGRWVAWGTQNRETALRKIAGSHFEIKVLDGLANIYFAMAAIVAAGSQGVAVGERLAARDCALDPGLLSREEREALGITTMLPQDLPSALEELERDEVLVGLLGTAFVERYLAVKQAEMEMLGGMEEEARKTWIMERY